MLEFTAIPLGYRVYKVNLDAIRCTEWDPIGKWEVLPIGKIVSMLKAVYGLKISAGTINNALVNVSESLQRFVNRVNSNINRCKSAGFDETGISINGSRGLNPLEEVKMYL